MNGKQNTGQYGEVPPKAGNFRTDSGEQDAGGGVQQNVGGVKPQWA
jgi:hypothetical protein